MAFQTKFKPSAGKMSCVTNVVNVPPATARGKWTSNRPGHFFSFLGRADSVLNGQAIWLCLGCETCTALSRGGNLPGIRRTRLALQKGIKPRLKAIDIYFRGFVDNMRLNGKIHDASVAGITQLLTGQLIPELPLAMKLLIRGRVKPPPLPFGGGKFRRIYRKALAKEKEARA
jgi:heterodisulfide reductase subunit C